jgi:hypothetical protein
MASEVFLETRATQISAVLEPKDTFQGNRSLSGMVSVRLPETIQEPTITPEGYYVFLDLPDGDYTLTVSAELYDYYGTSTFNTTTLDPINVAFPVDLQPNTSYPFPVDASLIRGSVRDQHGNPIAGVDVQAQGRSEFACSDVQGNFVLSFDVSAPELITLDFSKSGYAGESESVTVNPAQTTETQADLTILSDPDTAVLVGSVVDANGDPVTQAHMEVVSYSKGDITDLAGQGVLALVLGSATESVDVRLTHEGYAETIVNVSATKGQTTNFNAVMNLNVQPTTATLEVQVDDNSAMADLGDVLVEVIEKTRAKLTPAANGTVRFYFDPLPIDPEQVTIRMSKPGYVSKTRTRNIRAGEVKVVTIGLSPV